MIQRQVRKVADNGSILLTIPKSLVDILDLKAGQLMDVNLVGKKIIISKTEDKEIQKKGA